MRIPKFLTGVTLIALTGFLAIPAQAQNGQIVGQVTDAQSGTALSEVQVYIPGSGLGSLTRQDGRYILLLRTHRRTQRPRIRDATDHCRRRPDGPGRFRDVGGGTRTR